MDARETALKIMPHFSANVRARRVLPYGWYAKEIGLDPETQSVLIGPAMHAIGGACVIACVPVAPLHFVKRADGEWRRIFEGDLTEEQLVLPHRDTLYIAAKFYAYSTKDFERVTSLLLRLDRAWTPHDIWHRAAVWYVPNTGKTYFERALDSYKDFISREKARRRG